jgi:type VI secretion system protein ImpA
MAERDGDSTVLGGEAPPDASPSVEAVQKPTPSDDPILDPTVAPLCVPIAGAEPCGPDLDLEGDADYLNFFAQVEGVLPATFFNALDGAPFDPSSVELGSQLEALRPLLARTRDLRLLIVQARLQILNRDLGGFAASLAAIAFWLDQFWEQVHPRPEGGDFMARANAIAALDIPTVIFPLQYAPLFEARRLGTISYRTFLTATDETKPRAAEQKLDAAAVLEARGTADPAALGAARKNIALLKSAIDRVAGAFAKHGASVGLDNLVPLVGKMQAFIDPAEAARVAEEEAAGEHPASPELIGPGPTSLTEAREALATIAEYYIRREPSSPTLPLVVQAHQLIGKSFIEVISILTPAHVEKAAFQIGRDRVFELPIGKLPNLSGGAPVLAKADGDGTSQTTAEPPSGVTAPRFQVVSRPQAIALLEQVQRYFRASEPSSPVPMLCERARALAERDFMDVLRDVLPKAALRELGSDK